MATSSGSDAPSSPDPIVVYCVEIKADGDRCGVSKGIASNGYCNSHNPDKLCCGERRNGDKCKAPRLSNYDYCMPQHDPSLKYVDPALFRSARLRGATSMVQDVFTSGHFEDAYLGGVLADDSYLDGGNYHLDHVVECQVVASIFSKLDVRSDQEEKTIAALHEITNDPNNLRLTATWANMAKEGAIRSFLCDWRIRPANQVLAFADYVAKATWWSSKTTTMHRFDDEQVTRLCSVMATTMHWFLAEIESKMPEFPSKKIYKDVKKISTDLYGAMKLTQSASMKTPSKPKAKVDSPTKSSTTHATEKTEKKRRVRKPRAEAESSDTSSHSDSQESPRPTSKKSPKSKEPQNSPKLKPKDKGDSPARSSKPRTMETTAKKRPVRKTRVENNDSDSDYSDTNSHSESGSDSDSDNDAPPRSMNNEVSKPKPKEKTEKQEKPSKPRATDTTKPKRRVRKPRVEADESYSDNSSSDCESESDGDQAPQPRSKKSPTPKEEVGSPTKSLTTHVTEKTKPTRRVRKARVEADESYSDNSSSDSESESDGGEPPKTSRSRGSPTKERKPVAPRSPPASTPVSHAVEPADKPRARARSTKESS